MTTAVAPSAAQLRRTLTRSRQTHSNRTFWDVAQDAYVAAFSVVIIAVMTISAFVDIAGQLTSCAGSGCRIARGPLPVLVILAVAGASIRLLGAVGPVSSSRAVATWMLATPVDRKGLLRRPFALGSTVSAGVCILCLVVAGVVAGADVRGIVSAGALGAAVGALAAASTTLTQSRARARRGLVVLADVLLLGALVVLALVASGYRVIDAAWLDSPLVPAAAGAGVVLAVALLVWATRLLGTLGLPEVVAGGELLAGLAGAAYALDLALIGEMVAARRFRVLGARPSLWGHLSGPAAIVERELLRLTRSPGRFAGFIAFGLVPYLFDRAGLTPISPVVAGLAGYLAVRWSAAGLRRVWRSPGLRRAIPFDLPAQLVCFAAVPAVLSLVWAAGVSFALPGRWSVGLLVVALSVLAGVVRAASAQPPSYSGALVSSPMGALPPGMFTMVVRGPDAALVGTVALAAGLSPFWSVAIPAVLLVIVMFRAVSVVRGRPKPWEQEQK